MGKNGLVMFLALFVLLVACRFGQPLGQDEISHYYKCTRMLYLDGYSHPADVITFSPHLYPLVACGVCKLFGRFNQPHHQARQLPIGALLQIAPQMVNRKHGIFFEGQIQLSKLKVRFGTKDPLLRQSAEQQKCFIVAILLQTALPLLKRT